MPTDQENNEFRKEILELSFKVLDSQFKNSQKLMEIQRDLMNTALDMYDLREDEVREFALKSMEQAKANWEKTFETMKPQIPTMDLLLKQAKMFEDFISKKD